MTVGKLYTSTQPNTPLPNGRRSSYWRLFHSILPPRYLLRDRDAIYSQLAQKRIRALGIEEVISAPRSPWQNPYVERVIGSIRRDCLDHVIIFNERHLRRILRDYFDYYHSCRTHLSLNRDSPQPRSVEPEALGNIVALPQVGGLHHRYTRAAA
jgi:transposase InsO family protein